MDKSQEPILSARNFEKTPYFYQKKHIAISAQQCFQL